MHFIVGMQNSQSTINALVANGKRFMAYEIIKRLHSNNDLEILHLLSDGFAENESKKGQKYKVFKTSMDIKVCTNEEYIKQKLDYLHSSPCAKKWNLAAHPLDYKHSSIRFCEEHDIRIKSKLTLYSALFEERTTQAL